MKRLITTVMALLMVLMLAGCQQTPEEPVIVGKDYEGMIDKANQSVQTDPSNNVSEPTISLAEMVSAPEHYTETFQGLNGLVNMYFDADVILPEAQSIKSVNVEPADFSQDVVSLLFERLCGDKEMIYASQRTKEEIEQQLMAQKKWLAEIESGESTPSNVAVEGEDPVYDEAYVEAERLVTEKTIAALEQEYQNAPDTPSEIPCSGEMEQITIPPGYAGGFDENGNPAYATYTYLGLNAKEKDGHASFIVENQSIAEADEGVRTDNNYKAMLRFSDEGDGYSYQRDRFMKNAPISDESVIPDEAEGLLSVTPAEARERINQLIDGTGLAVCDIILIDDSQNGMVDNIVASAEHYGYFVTMSRNIEGVSVEYEDSITINLEDSYAPSWKYEHAYAIIDDRGIRHFTWQSPYTITDTVSENTVVMSFDEIIGVFQKMLPVTVGYDTNIPRDDLDEVIINIDRVTLSLQRILVPNTQGKGTLVPVWNFYGTNEKVEKGSGYVSGEGQYQLLMTINAIDGSMIDLLKGY